MGLHSGLTIETTLDPKVQPFLYDHQIDGTPVLPGVMGIEAFAEAALALLPGWHIEAVEAVNFLAPFKFYRGKSRVLTIQANLYVQNGGVVAECRLIGTRSTKKQKEPEVTTHFTARVRLTQQAPAEVMGTAPGAAPEKIVGADEHLSAFISMDRRIECWSGPGEMASMLSVRCPKACPPTTTHPSA